MSVLNPTLSSETGLFCSLWLQEKANYLTMFSRVYCGTHGQLPTGDTVIRVSMSEGRNI